MIKKGELPIRHNTHYVMNRGERMMQDTMVGKKFGNLVVQKLAYRGKDSKKYWECQCGCGRVCLVQESHLKNGHTKSCGCLRKKG